jgi:DNA-directed RNA polymerase subunit RPC12/RpoP
MDDKNTVTKSKYDQTIEIDYICYDCHKPFKAIQGSKRYLCPECLAMAISRIHKKDGE